MKMGVGIIKNATMAPGPLPRAASRDSGAAPKSAPVEVAPEQGDPIGKAEEAINRALQSLNTHVSITRDKATDHYVFIKVDKLTGEVMKQYPTKEVLGQIARVRQITGMAVDTGS